MATAARPLKIQLALQGGGAKIFALLAAMEAVETLRDDGLLQVTCIAGTSAGAVAGCLFAANVKMQDVRTVLQGKEGDRLLRSFAKLDDWRMSWRAFRGIQFWKTDILEGLLARFFDDRGIHTIEQLKKASGIDVHVVAADLSNARKITAAPTDRIVDALLDSTGLPFCFRTWPRDSARVIVDGGICENLPIRELQSRIKEDGPIAAVSFLPRRPGAPRTFRAFALALLDTAISNSMHNARSILPEIAIHEIDTDIGTLEFERALHEGLKDKSDAYEVQKLKADLFFRKFVASYEQGLGAKNQGKVQGNPWEETNPVAVEVMNKLGEAYFDQYQESRFKYKKCVFEMTVNSLRDPHDAESRLDKVKYSATFQPVDEPISCYSVGLNKPAAGEPYLGRTWWEVLDSERSVIKTIAIPARNPANPENMELLFFFVPVLRCGAGDYTLTFQDHGQNSMRPLLETGKDDLVYAPRRAAGNVDEIQLILHVPDEYQNLRMLPQATNSVPGRAMTPAELTGSSRSAGFTAYGWVGQNIPAAAAFGVDIVLGPRSAQ